MAQTLVDAEDRYDEHLPYHRPLQDLEAVYAALDASPHAEGTVELIVRRPAEREREVLEIGELSRTEGLVGDSWSSRPSKSTPDGSPDPLRQLTIMSSRALATVAVSPDRWRLAGDQLIVDLDLSIDNLPPGTRLRIGTAEVEVSEPPHTGCAKFSGRFGLDALRFVSNPEGKRQRRRGLNARVITAGTVRTGDRVTVRV
ncbi:MAG TPA: MOSC domain-containing protein [Nocardioidaceae bacterium]|nr:MOSC domain-containing protein [Nocardioidaceae bacterium]